MRILRLLGKALVFCATLAMLAGVCLFLTGAYLTTYPLVRKSPLHARRQLIAQIATALLALGQTFQSDVDPDAPSESR